MMQQMLRLHWRFLLRYGLLRYGLLHHTTHQQHRAILHSDEYV
jgi:hypothetical protein